MNSKFVAVWALPGSASQGDERNGGPMMRRARPRRRHTSIVDELSLPKNVTAEVLCDVFSKRVGRPLQQVLIPMPPDLPSGLIAVRKNSLSIIIIIIIIIDAEAPSWLQDMALCHELAHLGLGHHLLDLEDSNAVRRILPTLDPQAVMATLGGPVDGALVRTCFEDEAEREAEELGTELFNRLNPWHDETHWDVPSQAAGVISRIERALGVSTPAIWAHIDRIVTVPNLSLLISQGGVIAFSGTIQCLIIFWTTPRPSSRQRARWRVLWVTVVLVAMALLFAGADRREERPTDAAATYAHDPTYAIYLACYIAMVTLGVTDIIRLCLPYARSAGRSWLSRGLWFTAVGAALGLLYCAIRATTLLEAQLGTDPHRLEALVAPVASLGAMLIVVGLSMPSLGPRLSRAASWQMRRRSYRHLHPLWEAITVTIPEVVLDRDPPPASVVFRNVERRLGRRVVEIGDGIRQLRRHMRPAVLAAAATSAEQEGLTGTRRDAVTHAAQISCRLCDVRA
ncbi:MAB_1171c family putative transporter [Dactylosporangium sp. CA-233914]|uniref:MAB_1171c family putative transporter n=1 Tax=Dactylosporangium sp. CA-233914 TaxID=3239934 RepID=UPI003D94E9DE